MKVDGYGEANGSCYIIYNFVSFGTARWRVPQLNSPLQDEIKMVT